MTRNRYLLLSSALLTLALSACATPGLYSAESIEARVVDAETEQPIKDVIVVAHWQLMGGLEGGNPVGQLMVMEALSDAQGRFYFPAWEKRHWGRGWLGDEDPELIIFKSDFRYISVTNSEYTRPLKYRDARKPSGSSKRISFWNGETIRMERFKGNAQEYAQHVYTLGRALYWARRGEQCEWQQIPQMLVAIHRLSEQFDSQNIKIRGWRGGARVPKITDIDDQGKCGSAEEFFRAYLP